MLSWGWGDKGNGKGRMLTIGLLLLCVSLTKHSLVTQKSGYIAPVFPSPYIERLLLVKQQRPRKRLHKPQTSYRQRAANHSHPHHSSSSTDHESSSSLLQRAGRLEAFRVLFPPLS